MQPNDTFVISAKRGTGDGALVFGGLTFDSIVVPEPAGLAAAAAGVLVLSKRRRPA